MLISEGLMADIHLIVLLILCGKRGEADWLALQGAQVHKTGRLCAAELWDCYKENILSFRSWDEKQDKNYYTNKYW